MLEALEIRVLLIPIVFYLSILIPNIEISLMIFKIVYLYNHQISHDTQSKCQYSEAIGGFFCSLLYVENSKYKCNQFFLENNKEYSHLTNLLNILKLYM